MIRWGIIGTGSIARQFAYALREATGCRLCAVGSRSYEKAAAFSFEFGDVPAYGSYEELANDTNIDAVYVATPHNCHAENCLMSLSAGKAVLCEKPFTVNAPEASEVVRVARQRNIFLMEAMWTRFFPVMRRLREDVAPIAPIRYVASDFGFSAGFDPSGRLFNRDLAGGALLDVGVYAVSFASMLLGRPESVQACASFAETGVDEQTTALLRYPAGAVAVAHCSIRSASPSEATIVGENGWIRVHPPFWKPSGYTIHHDGEEEVVDEPVKGNGMRFEAEEAARYISEGKHESPVMRLDETVSIMETLDNIRQQIGLTYPFET